MVSTTSFAAILALADLASPRDARVPEFVSDTVRGILNGACCGAGVIIPVAAASLILTLSMRLMFADNGAN